jgi:simple sugar transport system substrate-binding protein
MIASGELHPFAGPIYNQEGTMVIGEGEVLDDGTLLGMNWYVQGVDDKLPE